MAKVDRQKKFEELSKKKEKEAMSARELLEGNLVVDDSVTDINPLLGAPVIEREYSSGQDMDVIGNIPGSMPEPEISRQTLDLTENPEDLGCLDSPEGGAQKQNPMFNEDMSSEDKAEQRAMTGNFSDTVIDGYKLLIGMIKNNATKSKEKYQWQAVQGKFDMRVLKANVDMGDGQVVAYGEFIKGYNEQIELIMCLDPNKEKEMRALLKRIALKRGLGMSDEMRLTLLVAEDVLTKAVTMYNLNKTLKNIEGFMLKHVQSGSATYAAPKQEVTPSEQPQNKSVNLSEENFEILEKGEK